MKQYLSMEWPFGKALLWGLLVFLQIHQHTGCFQEERIALLELKAFLESNIIHADGRLLSSWINDAKSKCCGWERVTCNSTTAHVIKLSLDNINQDPKYYDNHRYDDDEDTYKKRWLLNVSLFLPFKELTTLNLSGNAIGGCLPNEGFEKLSSLRNLGILDLGYNYFDNNTILQSLGAVTSLETLILTCNKLEGYFPAQELIALRNLNKLDISGNSFNGSLPLQGFESLSRLEHLKTLDLSFNYFDIRIIKSLSAVKTLKNLNLAWNNINGSFPAKGFESLSKLENLETLDLRGNYFDIRIIESLSAVKTLKHLNLASNRINGSFPTQGFESLSRLENLEILDLSNNYFDIRTIESLSAVKTLKNLNLASNSINGSFPTQGFKNLSRFEKLETLDLSLNYFDIRIIESLSAIKSLKNLDLSSNDIKGSFPAQGFKNLSRFEKLETLDLTENYFDIRIIESLSAIKSLKNLYLISNGINGSFPAQGLSNFSGLEILDLSGNYFTGSISPYIGALSYLKAISLASNKLNGTLPKELCSLKKLEELHLYDNSFEGILPSCLKNMTSLRILEISRNQFAGNISSSLIAIPTSLVYIDLSHNLFEGLFSFSLFANHSKLKVIMLVSENNKLEIETEKSVGWDLSFQLRVLVLRNYNLNKLTGNIPEFLFDQHKLEAIDLSHNNLKGSFPIWLLENNTGLHELNLQNNYFVGKFYLPPDRYKNIWSIDVSENHLDGQLQENIGKISPYLQYLNLSRNHFEGYLPSSVGEMSNLEKLDLSFNNFSGEIPTELFANCTFLEVLKLGNNGFNGEFFSMQFRLQNLRVLELKNNQFTGTLPAIPLRWNQLWYLDISNNNMSGTIPGWLVNMTSFETLDMSNNSFEGQIPCGSVNYLRLLDLSHNSLSGSLPSCFNLQFVMHLRLQGNKLTGPIPKVVFNSSFLLTLDLRDNSFFGSIPGEIGAISNLRILLLRGNNFSGIIPNQLCWLKMIGIMDLSKNSLSGMIPHCFHNLSFGKIFVADPIYNANVLMGWLFGDVGSTFQMLLTHDYGDSSEIIYNEQVEVEFVTKYRSNSYSGNILNYMSGLDLSCNNLTGKIPPELGELSSIHALNLSYNQLTSSISPTFSNLTQLESLDLSHNNLSGEIPSVLIDLTFLTVFTVAYNNLSGRVPDRKAQFATFEKSSYEGNSFLCGKPLENSCTRLVDRSHPSPRKSSNASEWTWYDTQVFSASFTASYIIFFLGATTLIYIHPSWQQWCFNLIEDFRYRCYYLVFDTLKRLSNHLYP